MDPDISVFTTTCVTCSLWMCSDRVQWTKVASDSTDLVFEDFMIEAGFEFTLTGLCGGDIARFLTSSEDDLRQSL